jgi:hypothetical protein
MQYIQRGEAAPGAHDVAAQLTALLQASLTPHVLTTAT